MTAASCRFCGAALNLVFVDLGSMPLANSFLRSAADAEAEQHYPLRVLMCEACLLVQVETAVDPSIIFSEYAYFSSMSESWNEHARRFALAATDRLRLSRASRVVEIASNDGYLLRHFIASGIPVLGVEPAANVAASAVSAGVPTQVAFFGRATAEHMVADAISADLLVANNVLAHVPNIGDFVAGLATVLAAYGTLCIEFPHLLRLITGLQFDTIYHEHYSYLSLLFAERVLAEHGLQVVDVDELPTHGGSLRLWVMHARAAPPALPQVELVRTAEREARLDQWAGYDGFAPRVERCRERLLEFLQAHRCAGHVCGYGAAAKGNTLLNYCGLTTADIPFVADRSPHKQGTLLPGSHIPVVSPAQIDVVKPGYVLILPWNLQAEIHDQLAHARSWGCRFVTAIPEVHIA